MSHGSRSEDEEIKFNQRFSQGSEEEESDEDDGSELDRSEGLVRDGGL